jgi:hypothetical protein
MPTGAEGGLVDRSGGQVCKAVERADIDRSHPHFGPRSPRDAFGQKLLHSLVNRPCLARGARRKTLRSFPEHCSGFLLNLD